MRLFCRSYSSACKRGGFVRPERRAAGMTRSAEEIAARKEERRVWQPKAGPGSLGTVEPPCLPPNCPIGPAASLANFCGCARSGRGGLLAKLLRKVIDDAGSTSRAWVVRNCLDNRPVLQYALIRTGRRGPHRRSIVLAVIVAASGVYVVRMMAFSNITNFRLASVKFLWLDLTGICLFCAYVAAAVSAARQSYICCPRWFPASTQPSRRRWFSLKPHVPSSSSWSAFRPRSVADASLARLLPRDAHHAHTAGHQ